MEERIHKLIRQAEQTLLEPDSAIGDDGDWTLERAPPSKELVSEVEHLHGVIRNLESKLKSKTDLCDRLEATLNKVLSSTKSGGINIKQEDLTRDYFYEVCQSWTKQVWFQKAVPVVVENTYEMLKSKIELEYESEKRRTAFTFAECQKIVDKVREEWKTELPVPVQRSLTADNKVYSSAADRSSGPGRPCEAVHYLVYLVFRLYNRAAHALHTLKKNEGLHHLGADSIALAKELAGKDKGKAADGDDLTKPAAETIKWYNNPHTELQRFLLKARRSVINAPSLSDIPGWQNAITLSVARLIASNKPTMEDSLQYLASIISLHEYGDTMKWSVDDSLCRHRDILQFKMIECWHTIGFKGDWSTYRTRIFQNMNSLLVYVVLCRGHSTIEPLTLYLQQVVRPGHKRELASAVECLRSDILPLFQFLQEKVSVSTISEYMSFYARLFVFLLHFLASVEYASTVNHESILLNLLTDLSVTKDQSKLSSSEKKDYVKVLSIVSSVIIARISNIPNSIDEGRTKLAKAAWFLCSRFRYTVSGEAGDKGRQLFWHESYEDYKLILYCDDDQLERLRKLAPAYKLPLLEGADVDDIADVDDMELELLESSTGLNEALPDRNPQPIRGLKVKRMREILIEKRLPADGKKKQLQQRLVDTGEFTYLPVTKKRKGDMTSDESSSSGGDI